MDEGLFLYALRITPYPNTEPQVAFVRSELPKFMESLGSVNWLFGKEYEDNHHFHIVFSIRDGELSKKKSKSKKDFTELLYSTFRAPEDKRGNAFFSIEPVRDIDKATAYAVKDGDFETSAEWEELANDASERSFQKSHSMKSGLAKIAEQFCKNEINEEEAFVQLWLLRSELMATVKVADLDGYILSFKGLKDPEFPREFWRQREIKRNNI